MANQRKKSDAEVTLGTILEGAAEWGARIGLIVGGATLGIMAYQTAGGSLYKANVPNAVAVVDKISSWHLYMALMVAFIWGIRRTEQSEERVGYVGIYGVAMWFGFSYLVRIMGNKYAQGQWQNSEAVKVLLTNVLHAGQWTLLTLLIPGLRAGWGKVVARAEMKQTRAYKAAAKLKRESPKSGGKPNVLSPCWRLPYCRDYLLSVCPAYKARRRCWKLKRGCFCDNSMLENLITGVKGSTATQQAYMRSEIDARNSVAAQRGAAPPCRRCFIYLEHQELKYSVMAPLVYPVVGAVCYFGYKPLVVPAWDWVQKFLADIWSKIALTTTVNQGMEDVFGNKVISTLFAVILYFVVVLVLLRLVELWCYKWKL
ncbi:MAG: hypothetical protein HZB16_02590 [Armatimonadetes bacterium]|nr:hypothetical protein [Armatimonadota bacterium]